MTPRNAWIYALLPFVTMVALGAGVVVVYRQRAAARRDVVPSHPPPAAPPRPWWGNPWLWVGVCLAGLLLGWLVWPGLFGVCLVVLPFVWIRRPRSSAGDPRSNGHANRDGGAFSRP